MTQRTSTLLPPQGRWWLPLGKDERLWCAVVVVWGLAMFVMMLFVWPAIGDQQVVFESYRVDPAEFQRLTDAFITKYRSGSFAGVPVVEPPPGDVYVMGERFQFKPALKLKQGQTYRFLVSSKDVQHGLSLQPDNINFQVVPGYVLAIHLTPKQSGEYHLVCNEYCGTGHHLMLGHIEVAP